MIYVYVIQSEKNESLYVGMTKEISNRLKEHNAGKSKYTKSYCPWKIVYEEEVPNWELGRKREKYLKSTAGKNWLRKEGIIS